MPDLARPAPPADLAALVPAQRTSGPVPAPGPVPVPVPVRPSPAAAVPERLAFLWALLGALAGSAIVAVAFLVLLTLLR